MPPAGLNHTHFGINEIRDRLPEKILAGDKIGIKDTSKLPLGRFQSLLQGSCLIASTDCAV